MQQTIQSYDGHGPALPAPRLSVTRPLVWLRMGWDDLRGNPSPAIGHGAILVAIGALILTFCSMHIDYLAVAVTGFLLLAPLFGAGLYALARLRERGEPATFDASLQAALQHGARLERLGAVLALLAIGWAVCSRILFVGAYGGTTPAVHMEINRTLLEWNYPGFFVSYMATGAVFAAIAFVVSAVAAPMLFDRDVSTRSAIATSLRVVAAHPLTMLSWAAIVAVTTFIGFALALVGLAVVFPVLGFATWHAYRELVPRE